MTSAATDMVSLFYEEKGSGQPLLFVHGVLNDYRCWKYQTEAFSRRYRTIAYSRRYSWPNLRSADLTVEQRAELPNHGQLQVADLDGLVDRLGISPVHLVGHSGGGVIACYFAMQHPEKIRSLTLVNSAIATILVDNPLGPLAALSLLFRYPSIVSSAAGIRKRYNAAIKALDAGDAARAADLFRTNPKSPRLEEDFERMRVDNARTLREAQTRFPHFSRRDVEKIQKPTLVMAGENSAKFDLKISEKLAEAIPNCESLLISRSGHNCFCENPAEFNSRLSDFLLKHG